MNEKGKSEKGGADGKERATYEVVTLQVIEIVRSEACFYPSCILVLLG